MDVENFIEDIGGRGVVIAETGLSKGRISQWCKTRQIPKPWVKFFGEKYPEACHRHGITEGGVPAPFAQFAESLPPEKEAVLRQQIEHEVAPLPTLEARAERLHALTLNLGATFSLDEVRAELAAGEAQDRVERDTLTRFPDRATPLRTPLPALGIVWRSARSTGPVLVPPGDGSASADAK